MAAISPRSQERALPTPPTQRMPSPSPVRGGSLDFKATNSRAPSPSRPPRASPRVTKVRDDSVQARGVTPPHTKGERGNLSLSISSSSSLDGRCSPPIDGSFALPRMRQSKEEIERKTFFNDGSISPNECEKSPLKPHRNKFSFSFFFLSFLFLAFKFIPFLDYSFD